MDTKPNLENIVSAHTPITQSQTDPLLDILREKGISEKSYLLTESLRIFITGDSLTASNGRHNTYYQIYMSYDRWKGIVDVEDHGGRRKFIVRRRNLPKLWRRVIEERGDLARFFDREIIAVLEKVDTPSIESIDGASNDEDSNHPALNTD